MNKSHEVPLPYGSYQQPSRNERVEVDDDGVDTVKSTRNTAT